MLEGEEVNASIESFQTSYSIMCNSLFIPKYQMLHEKESKEISIDDKSSQTFNSYLVFKVKYSNLE